MTIKEKILNLISKANSTTGKSDNDLTSGVNSLIEGYGQGGGVPVSDDFNVDELIPQLMPKNIRSYTDSRLVSFADGEFKGKTSLERVDCINATTVGKETFYGCTALEIFNTRDCSIGESAFEGCSSLKKVPLITALSTKTFAGCTSLEVVRLGAAVSSIGTGAFVNCAKLKALCLLNPTSVAQVVVPDTTYFAVVFGGTPIADGTGYVYVPSKMLSKYQSDAIWSQYSSQLRVLEDYTVDGTTNGELDETKI